MNKSKRERFRLSVQRKMGCFDTCDLCRNVGPGTTHYHLGAPVLFVCNRCL